MGVSDFTDMMPHTVTHATVASRDTYGAKTYNTATSYTARVTYKPTMVRSADGMEVLARGVVWLMGSPAVDPDDQITLPDSTTPPILAAELIPDEDGAHHTKVYFG